MRLTKKRKDCVVQCLFLVSSYRTTLSQGVAKKMFKRIFFQVLPLSDDAL
jgi:hypothetical protein